MRFRCRVIETTMTYRHKDVVVEVESLEVVQRLRNFVRDEADQMGGWVELAQHREFSVLPQREADQQDRELETITIEPSTEK